ncbi:MAG: glutathione peroxidase [Verrucomicrobiota bacterium]
MSMTFAGQPRREEIFAEWKIDDSLNSMLHRIIIPAFVMSSSAFAADLTKISFDDAAGHKTSLKDYKGKVVLVVNLASKCGLTPQYEGLEALYRQHKDKGFVVIGFPCNDFGGQEPGTIAEIQEFCKTRYDVSFPVMTKISVKGDEQHKLYEALTGKNGAFPGDVRWNFGKFLIGRDGKPIARFEPTTAPESQEITAAVGKALAEKE